MQPLNSTFDSNKQRKQGANDKIFIITLRIVALHTVDLCTAPSAANREGKISCRTYYTRCAQLITDATTIILHFIIPLEH